MWMHSHLTPSQPTCVPAGADPFTGIRTSAGYAEATRIDRIRPVSGVEDGVVAPNGLALKEGET